MPPGQLLHWVLPGPTHHRLQTQGGLWCQPCPLYPIPQPQPHLLRGSQDPEPRHPVTSIPGSSPTGGDGGSLAQKVGSALQDPKHGLPAPHRPKYKGRFCLGERRRIRLCNLQACPPGQPSFRHVQCSHFDSKPYKGQLHTWVPVFDYGKSFTLGTLRP